MAIGVTKVCKAGNSYLVISLYMFNIYIPSLNKYYLQTICVYGPRQISTTFFKQIRISTVGFSSTAHFSQ